MTSSFSSLLPHQPFKTLYLALVIPLILLRLPLWLLYFLPRTLRQHPSWTFRQALTIHFFKTTFHHFCRVRAHPQWTLVPGDEKDQFERIPPKKPDLYDTPILNSDPTIKPVEIGGTWYPHRFDPSSPTHRKHVILHFHGGAFVVGNGRKADLGFGAGLLTSAVPSAYVFGLQYRIASNPGCRFPAALQDAVTGYQHILDKGVPASSIIISGDSAGGNLAIALLRYITEHPELGIPTPRAALLWCAWANPGGCLQGSRPCSSNRNYDTDFLVDVFAEWGIMDYAPHDPHNPYVSPRDHPFLCEGVPMWVQFGSLEVLADDVVKFAEGMRGVQEGRNEVRLQEVVGAPHDVFIIGGTLGFGGMARGMVGEMGRWLEGKLGKEG
ncbi:MAG: hypothetical protein Q9220_003842 [cf. Caloplaca sp. 1 TL-2023]